MEAETSHQGVALLLFLTPTGEVARQTLEKESLSYLLFCKIKTKSPGPCLLEGKEIIVIKASKVVI